MPRLLLVLLLCFVTDQLHADNWAQFRGPNFNGSSNETNLPSSWSTTENVKWVAEMPGPSAATPTVWEDSVFISSTDREADTLLAMALDRASGDVLWQHTIAEGTHRDTRSNYAAPTPTTDGEVVVFFYGTGKMVAYNLKGKDLWKRDIAKDYGEFAFGWTFSTSPILYQGRLYLQVLQRDTAVDGRGFKDRKNESYLLALDPKTGNELWKVNRPSNAVVESREAFTTPIPFAHDGRDEILIAGGDAISGHDPTTGKELWRWGTWNPTRIPHWRLVPSPVAGKGVILACAPKGSPIYAVKAGGNGVLPDSELAWVSDEQKVISSDVPTPAFYDGDFFVLNKGRKVVTRVDPTSGDIRWQSKRLPGSVDYEASPLAADGKIYVVNFNGRVVVLDATSGDIVSDIDMQQPITEERTRSSIVAAHGELFIRTTNRLYCVAK